jgi:hypothetical protein
MTLENCIFALWVLAPVLFLVLALWAALERASKNKATHPGEHLVAALFLAICGVVAFGVHRYLLDSAIAFVPVMLPRELYLFLVWPLVLYVGAKVTGPSREILIERVTGPLRRR